MNSKIYQKFSEGFQSGHFLRIGESKSLNLYIGKDDHARYCFEFRGHHTPTKVFGSDVISVSQTKSNDEYCLRFSLADNELLEHFCTFCEDILDSTANVIDENIAYKTICARYSSWKKLFKASTKKLSEIEIMGLIGELLFLQDQMFPKYGIITSLDSWTGPEKTHKDFSCDGIWYEIKTVNSGKESVHISSIEQLDSDIDGVLAIYKLEKMSPTFNGLKLTGLVASILNKLETSVQKELFMSKLELFGFDFSPEYDNYVYSLTDYSAYNVTSEFPRLLQGNMPKPVIKVQYEIIIPDIQDFKQAK